MPQSLSKVLVHLIFSTKHREPLIGPEIRPRLHAYIVGILDNLKSPSLQTGGVADHVHSLFLLGRTISQAELVEEVKKSSSKWMKAEGGVPGFSWQTGYGAFDVPKLDLKNDSLHKPTGNEYGVPKTDGYQADS
jgi:REP element-mobilizing transposase RayT